MALAAVMFTTGGSAAHAADKPTIILVHGAFAESNSWDGVIRRLEADGYRVVGAANPLRSVNGDAASVAAIVVSIKGSVVLVGHSYGGTVISNAANGHLNVKALVFVSAFAPDAGETVAQLADKFPGSTLGPALAAPVDLLDGNKDLYIDQKKFRAQFAADVPEAEAKLMAVGQRPIAATALDEASSEPAWRSIPSWFVYGDADRNIPAATIAWMAERAGSKKTVAVKGASHVVMVSHPGVVADLIEEAASTVGGK